MRPLPNAAHVDGVNRNVYLFRYDAHIFLQLLSALSKPFLRRCLPHDCSPSQRAEVMKNLWTLVSSTVLDSEDYGQSMEENDDGSEGRKDTEGGGEPGSKAEGTGDHLDDTEHPRGDVGDRLRWRINIV